MSKIWQQKIRQNKGLVNPQYASEIQKLRGMQAGNELVRSKARSAGQSPQVFEARNIQRFNNEDNKRPLPRMLTADEAVQAVASRTKPSRAQPVVRRKAQPVVRRKAQPVVRRQTPPVVRKAPVNPQLVNREIANREAPVQQAQQRVVPTQAAPPTIRPEVTPSGSDFGRFDMRRPRNRIVAGASAGGLTVAGLLAAELERRKQEEQSQVRTV